LPSQNWCDLPFDESFLLTVSRFSVQKFVRDFFLPDNSLFMQQRLLTWRQLVAYHDPQLATHLHTIGFAPDLFAIPWFLTLFTRMSLFFCVSRVMAD
jgi:hypothetical protein